MKAVAAIRFVLNDEEMALPSLRPTETLRDFLRLNRHLTGTKEGCAEGDCGACTVLVGRLIDGGPYYESVNACIRFVGSLHATHVVTVEHLAAVVLQLTARLSLNNFKKIARHLI